MQKLMHEPFCCSPECCLVFLIHFEECELLCEKPGLSDRFAKLDHPASEALFYSTQAFLYVLELRISGSLCADDDSVANQLPNHVGL